MENLTSIIQKAQAGDISAFNVIVENFQDMAIGYAYTILKDRYLAEDAVQEAFIQAFLDLKKLKSPKAFSAWFRKVILTQCDKLTRKKSVFTVPLPANHADRKEKQPLEKIQEQEDKDEIIGALETLSDREKESTVLFYINGYSMSDIGRFLEVPEKTVKSRLYSARQKLKEHMETNMKETIRRYAPGSGFKSHMRLILEGVKRLGETMAGSERSPFIACLRAVLQYKNEDIPYHYLLAASGTGFSIYWDDEGWFKGEFAQTKTSLDPEFMDQIKNGFEAAGCDYSIIANRNFRDKITIKNIGKKENAPVLREKIVDSININMPVIALGLVGPADYCIITGYDEGGSILTGWSFYQENPYFSKNLEFEANGYFRKRNWEPDTAGIILIGEKINKPDKNKIHKNALLNAVQQLSSHIVDGKPRGLKAYDTWIGHLLNEELFKNPDKRTLMNHLEYHSGTIGQVAEHRAYASSFLTEMSKTRFFIGYDILNAAACFARIHELVWLCWQVAGGYWRDKNKELKKFIRPEIRKKAAAFLEEAKKMDEKAIEHLKSALANFEKNHGTYMTM